MDELKALCQQYTNLTEQEIEDLLAEARVIEQTPDYRHSDVFIDVRNEFTNQAVVVFHKPPQIGESLYHRKVVGQTALRTNEPGVFHTLETQLASYDLLAETQEQRLIRQRIYPIIRNDRTIGVTIVEADVSENILESFQGKDRSARYKDVSATIQMFGRQNTAITDQLADAILIFDQTGTLVLANHTAMSLYQRVGYIGTIIGLNYENLSLDGSRFKEIRDQLGQVNEQNQHVTSTLRYLNYFFEERKFWNQDKQQLVILIEDKTDVKNKEAEIISKSVAIREINHRVKNNLQSVISLLRIQQRRLEDDQAKKALSESVGRIMAIASTYELMSKQLDDATKLHDAISLLVSHLMQLDRPDFDVKVDIDVDSTIKVENEQVVTISIIVNELLQNALSHAFTTNSKEPQILIQGRVEHEIVTITVSDNGHGFDINNTRNGSLGLTIIRSYVRDKLLGKLNIESDTTGTSISFSFDQKTQQ